MKIVNNSAACSLNIRCFLATFWQRTSSENNDLSHFWFTPHPPQPTTWNWLTTLRGYCSSSSLFWPSFNKVHSWFSETLLIYYEGLSSECIQTKGYLSQQNETVCKKSVQKICFLELKVKRINQFVMSPDVFRIGLNLLTTVTSTVIVLTSG